MQPDLTPDPSLTSAGARQKKPEWTRQAWLHRFLDRVVFHPREIRGIDQSGAHQKNMATRQMAIGRGCKPGTSDHFVWQGEPSVMCCIEVKHEGGERVSQAAFRTSLARCGFLVVPECRTTAEALAGLREAGMRLHPNAEALAVEYQARMDAALAQFGKSAPKKKRAVSRPRERVHRAAGRISRARLGL